MKKKVRYQAFISSTYEDLKEERTEVAFAVLECDCFPAGMELFVASNNTQWDVIKKVIDESDYYILIIGGRYGSTVKEEYTDAKGRKKIREVSYTEKEFDYALKNNKPIIAFIHENYASLPLDKCEKSQKGLNLLENFRRKAMQGRIIKKWTNKGDLKASAISAITNLISEEEEMLKGWIPYDQVGSIEKNIDATEKLEMMEKVLNDARRAEEAAKKQERDAKERIIAAEKRAAETERKYHELMVDSSQYFDSIERFIVECSNDPSKLDSNPQLLSKVKEEQERKRRIIEFEESEEYLQGMASVAQDLQ